MQTIADPGALRELLRERGISMEAAAMLAGLNTATIHRIVNGQRRARPVTVVQLAKALGVGARRLQVMCDAAWQAAEDEAEGEAGP